MVPRHTHALAMPSYHTWSRESSESTLAAHPGHARFMLFICCNPDGHRVRYCSSDARPPHYLAYGKISWIVRSLIYRVQTIYNTLPSMSIVLVSSLSVVAVEKRLPVDRPRTLACAQSLFCAYSGTMFTVGSRRAHVIRTCPDHEMKCEESLTPRVSWRTKHDTLTSLAFFVSRCKLSSKQCAIMTVNGFLC
jgi:hypothetical protein